MKRAEMSVDRSRKRTRSNRKTMVPMVFNPGNLWGVTLSKRAMPPVLIVSVNHLRGIR